MKKHTYQKVDNMIKNKSDLKRYLEMDRYALGRGGDLNGLEIMFTNLRFRSDIMNIIIILFRKGTVTC